MSIVAFHVCVAVDKRPDLGLRLMISTPKNFHSLHVYNLYGTQKRRNNTPMKIYKNTQKFLLPFITCFFFTKAIID